MPVVTAMAMTNGNIPQEEKIELRKSVLAARENLSPQARRRALERILPRLLDLPGYRSAHRVAAYMSFGSEIDTRPFVDAVLAEQKILVLPRVDRATRALDLHEVADLAALTDGQFGIREPAAGCPRAEAASLDFILVPGVAFDRRGQRIGHGAGYYDRLLARRGAHTVCVAIAFDCQVVERIPAEPHDQPIDRLITESFNHEFTS
jgi:5,10-methenyltetrahydrofolate synthetase